MISNLTGSVDMADISGDTRCAADIIQAQGRDQFVLLQEERQWLANTSASAEDGNLGLP